MIDRFHTPTAEARIESLVADEDPWTALTHFENESETIPEELLPGSMEMPDFSIISEDQISNLLPKPLQEAFLLTQSYVRLIEIAKRIPSPQLYSVVVTIKSGAEEVSGFNSDFSKAIVMLAEVVEHCHEEEATLLERFRDLQNHFETLTSKDRELFIATIQEVTESCEMLVE